MTTIATAAKRKAASTTIAATGEKKARTTLTSFFVPVSSSSSLAPSSSPPSSQPSLKSSPSKGDDNTSKPSVSAPFDKSAWIASLTTEQRDLLQLEINTMDDSWLAALRAEFTKPYFLSLKRFLIAEDRAGQKVLPPARDVYSWSRLTPLDKVKVVVIGQDPYHNFNQAHGLAFSVKPPTAVPPSLRNIYIALKNDYPEFVPPAAPAAGDLTKWAERGVLLLNTCLTVRAHAANSHAGKGWEQFTERVIAVVAERRKQGVVFLAWGSPAGKRVDKINKSKHCVLRAVHPSPLSASRGFFDCGHFKKTNEWLKEHYGDDAEIEWTL
ncbi:uracil-DNA glycosylase-like protein [Limtongia smithiae]|uniref:uracil-DNA glycosylase-like protein n=1 Tax=Limtongia smithiae TaxID=1125753 RepID=UPI0034CFDBD7